MALTKTHLFRGEHSLFGRCDLHDVLFEAGGEFIFRSLKISPMVLSASQNVFVKKRRHSFERHRADTRSWDFHKVKIHIEMPAVVTNVT